MLRQHGLVLHPFKRILLPTRNLHYDRITASEFPHTMSGLNLKVLISGGGIAGSCLAYWLSRTRHNISITVIERSPSPRPTGQCVDIRDQAIEIIKLMGLEKQIRDKTTQELGTTLLGRSGKPVATFMGTDNFTAEYEILRADLSKLFLDATDKLNNVKYIYGDQVTSLEQTEKKVNVTMASGARESFDLFVAADGSTSRTRAMFLDAETLKDSYHLLGQYIAFFSVPSEPTDGRLWQWYNRPGGRCVMMRPHRTSETRGVYLCITMPAHGQRDPVVEAAMDKGTDETKRMLHDYFKGHGWQTERLLKGMDECDDFYMARAATVKLPKWTNGRAVVLGDAAHATFGIGTSLAIEGAYSLAGAISEMENVDQVSSALQKFEDSFRPKTTEDELPPFYPQIAFPNTSTGLFVLNSFLWFASTSRLYKLLGLLFANGGEAKWTLPAYEWTKV